MLLRQRMSDFVFRNVQVIAGYAQVFRRLDAPESVHPHIDGYRTLKQRFDRSNPRGELLCSPR
jgi:hypothetical protein